MRRHPTTASGRNVLGVTTVGGEVPVDQAVEGKPAEDGKDALAQAHRDSDGRPERAGPNEDLDYVLNHNCELAASIPVATISGRLGGNDCSLIEFRCC